MSPQLHDLRVNGGWGPGFLGDTIEEDFMPNLKPIAQGVSRLFGAVTADADP